MKKILSAFAAAAIFAIGSAAQAEACCPPTPVDLSSYSHVSGSTAAGPNQVSFAASHAGNQGFAVVTPEGAIAGNHSEGSAVQVNGIAQFEAGGYAGGDMARYGCFDTAIGVSTYSEVGGAAFNQHMVVDAESGAFAAAGLDYGRFDVQTYADGMSYSGVIGNGAAMAGYDAYANVDND